MTDYETQVQARTDQLFDVLDGAFFDADLTPYDAAGTAYVVDFDDGTALLVSVESYEPLGEVDVYLGDAPEDRP